MQSFIILLLFVAFSSGQECGSKPPQRPWDPSNFFAVTPEDGDAFIVGGRESDPGAWPWQLSLQYLREDEWRHTCGAILIDSEWAITAAHCTNNRQDFTFRLVMGAHNRVNLTGDEQISEIEEIIQHPNFIESPILGFPNDIGLLRLSDPANLSDPRVDVACLPDNADDDFSFVESESCWISGWGLLRFNDPALPPMLQEANPYMPNSTYCKNNGIPQLRESHICVGRALGLPNACSGDSGGPLSCLVDGKWYAAGATSFGDSFCSLYPSVYTRISFFHDWIMETISK